MTNYQFLIEYFALGFAGASAAELLKVYELRGKLATAKYRATLRSPLFWLVLLGMLASSGFIAWAVNATTQLAPWQVVLSGIGARSLIRAPIQAQTANRRTHLGGTSASEARFHVRDMFL